MSQSPTGAPASPAPARARRRWPLALTFLIASAWIAFLVVLTLISANPVTLNREQILESTLVIAGEVEDLPAGKVSVLPDADILMDQTIVIRNLQDTPARPGERYLFPLQPVFTRGLPERGVFQATPSRLPDRAPLIYPDGEIALRQLQAIRASAPPADEPPPRRPMPRD
jgi:hypothetical protein